MNVHRVEESWLSVDGNVEHAAAASGRSPEPAARSFPAEPTGEGKVGTPAPGSGREAAAPLEFNKEVNKNQSHQLGDFVGKFKEIYGGGKFDEAGGAAARYRDIKRFEALSEYCRLPVFITLTVAREGSPGEVYDKASKKIAELLTDRLGLKLWGRVLEVQAENGDGWPHWHIIADVADTDFDDSAKNRFRPVNLSLLKNEILRAWVGLWKLGAVSGQNFQLVQKRKAVAAYLSKYVSKPWAAVPPWIGQRAIIRTVGFSKAANDHFRTIPGLGDDRKSDEGGDIGGDDQPGDGSQSDNPGAGESDKPSETAKRKVVSLFERLAASGLWCKVVNGGGFVGKIKAPLFALLDSARVALASVRYYAGAIVAEPVQKAVFGVLAKEGDYSGSATLESIRGWAHRAGWSAWVDAEYERRLEEWRRNWDYHLGMTPDLQ